MFLCKGIGKERNRRNQSIQMHLLLYFRVFLGLVIPGFLWKTGALDIGHGASVGLPLRVAPCRNSAAGTSGRDRRYCHRSGGPSAAGKQGAELARSRTAGPSASLCCSAAEPSLPGCRFEVYRCEGKSDVVLEAASSGSLDLSTKCHVPTTTRAWRDPWLARKSAQPHTATKEMLHNSASSKVTQGTDSFPESSRRPSEQLPTFTPLGVVQPTWAAYRLPASPEVLFTLHIQMLAAS